MSEQENGNELLGLTEKIVSAHVAKNAVSSTDLPNLIKSVHAALQNVSAGGETALHPNLWFLSKGQSRSTTSFVWKTVGK